MQEALSRLLTEVTHRFYQHLRSSPVHHELGTTPLQAKLLMWIWRTPGATASQFCEHIGRDRGQVARLIGQLLKDGLIERQPSPEDGRVLWLSLTERGEAHAHRLKATWDELARASFQGISEEDQAHLERVLSKLRDNLIAM